MSTQANGTHDLKAITETYRNADGLDEDDAQHTHQRQPLEKFTLTELQKKYPTLAPPVVDGLFREGETANLISVSKVGKSWLAYNLAISIVMGWDWIGKFPTAKGRVLLIDNELHRSTLAHRIPKVGAAMGVARGDFLSADEYGDQLDIWPLRGDLRSLQELGREFEKIEACYYKAIIFDAKYRFDTEGVSENDNAAETQIYNLLDRYSATRSVSTFAKMFSLTRQDIINDDLSAFDDLRNRVGRGAITRFNRLFWSVFLDNASFFTAGNKNVATVAGGLTADGDSLAAAVLAFRKLKTADGKSVDGEPTTLLCPPELEFAARRLYQSTNVAAAGTADVQAANKNVYEGLYKPSIQNRLSDTEYTGNSPDAWYLLRDPRVSAVVCVSFLNGQQSPTVDVAEADFNTLGIQMRGYHDFGCDRTVDYLSGIRIST